jgi:hypothetical protein
MRNENPISAPAGTLRSVIKRTPLAETFTVAAANSSSSVDRTTGRLNGNRTAQRTSCRTAPSMPGCETGNSVLNGFIQPIPLPEAIPYSISKEGHRTQIREHQSFFHLGLTLTRCQSLENTSSGVYPRIVWYSGAPVPIVLTSSYTPVTRASPQPFVIRMLVLSPKGGRCPHPLLVAVVVHSHHLAASQSHQRERGGQLTAVRPYI